MRIIFALFAVMTSFSLVAGTPKPVVLRLTYDPYICPSGSNIVKNPGFANGTIGWTVTGNYDTTTRSGGSGMALRFNAGQKTPNAIASQTLTTVPGLGYTVSFDYGIVSWNATSQTVQVNVDGATPITTQQWSATGTSVLTFSRKSFTFVANSTSTTLTFKDISTATDSIDSAIGDVVVDPTLATGVITIYKCTSLGIVTSPWKKTAILPWTRNVIGVTVLPGTWYFRATASTTPAGGTLVESDPSNTITVNIKAP